MLVITKQGEFDSFFSILEIKEKTFNVLQTIETLFRESFEFNPRKTPWKFEVFSNGNLEKKSEEFSLFATSKVTNCV